ncbi:MAG: tetratricopeptide repeat protein [Planctomycetes bacterium]|nr:tetratricopeptide repeat protein [Planctomycetota bacterium]
MPTEPTNAIKQTATPSRYESAASLLEKATALGYDSQIHYMLALAYKRQNKIAEARAALRKIRQPEASVFLQMGLLSLTENNLTQAEEEFSRGWSLGNNSYEIGYNLLMVRLTLGKVEGCLELIPPVLGLLEQRPPINVEDHRFLGVLRALLLACQQRESPGGVSALLADLTPFEEQRLLKVVRSLGQLDTAYMLLEALNQTRPRSLAVKEAFIETVLVKGKLLIDRCQWTDAELLLRPFVRDRGFSKSSQVGLLTLLGTCAAMTQDMDGAMTLFHAALKLAPNDARLHQNLALAYELRDDLAQADNHWNRFFDLLDPRSPAPSDIPKYTDRLIFEGLHRLASRYGEKEQWSNAVPYAQRAAHMRPDDPESLERLFQLYNNAKRPNDARRTLETLRQLKPGEPQYDLYELDLIEVKGLNDIERLLTEIDKIRRKYPNDARVDDRATSMVNSVIPLIADISDKLTDQLGKVKDQINSLPNYQINWAAVRDVMRELMKEFQKLRRMVGKCIPLVSLDDQRRTIRELADHIDKKIEACRSMGA